MLLISKKLHYNDICIFLQEKVSPIYKINKIWHMVHTNKSMIFQATILLKLNKEKKIMVYFFVEAYLPRPQQATALAVDECAYSRDDAPLSPAVR
jgi:hypothetical protein